MVKYAVRISCCVFIMLFSFNAKSSQVVDDLKALLDREPTLKSSLLKAIETKNTCCSNIEEFYKFLDEWRTYVPGSIAHAQDYSERFKSLYRKKGIDSNGNSFTYYVEEVFDNLLRKEVFIDWMQKFVHERGVFMDSSESMNSPNSAWIKNGLFDMSSFQIPVGGFVSFNDFFTRKLLPGKRPISDPDNNAVLTSPADCKISPVSYYLTAGQDFTVKGDTYNVAALFNSVELAKRFIGGTAVVCLLYPENYHRFHSPVAGYIVGKGSLDDKRYYGFKGLVKYFSEYHRAYYLIETPNSGQVGFVAIGMSDINSVNMTLPIDPEKKDMIKKGDELGYFKYGGSGIVLLFEPGVLEKSMLKATGSNGDGGLFVQVGKKIGSLNIKNPSH